MPQQVFGIAAKSWEEQKAIRNILYQRFFPILAAIMHERNKFSGKLVTQEALPRLTLTEEVFNEGLRRCPDLVDELIAQLNHPAIRENGVRRLEAGLQ